MQWLFPFTHPPPSQALLPPPMVPLTHPATVVHSGHAPDATQVLALQDTLSVAHGRRPHHAWHSAYDLNDLNDLNYARLAIS